MLIGLAAFLLVLGVIVFIHEFGHFAVAKLFGVRVLVFSLGFGKRLAGFDFRGTDVRISAIPLGGYVQMWGDLPEDRTGALDELPAKPRWQRILIYLAGPAMNVVLSVGLIAAAFMSGIAEQAYQDMPSVIGHVFEGSRAEQAGLVRGDQIVAIDGKPVDRWGDLMFALQLSPEKAVSLQVTHEGATREVVVTPERIEPHDIGDAGIEPAFRTSVAEVIPDTPAERAGLLQGDVLREVDGMPIHGPNDFVEYILEHPGVEVLITLERADQLIEIAVTPERVAERAQVGIRIGLFRKLPLGEAVVASVRYNVEIVTKSVVLIGKLLTNQVAAKSALSGPIEIASISGRAAKRGWRDLIFTMGFLSISIGFMNLLPIPVLDGGHITILLIESAIRRDLSVVIKERMTQVGFMLLMMLMVMVLYFDLAKNLPSLPGL
jgi:regulator of sigma E protease